MARAAATREKTDSFHVPFARGRCTIIKRVSMERRLATKLYALHYYCITADASLAGERALLPHALVRYLKISIPYDREITVRDRKGTYLWNVQLPGMTRLVDATLSLSINHRSITKPGSR